MNTSLHYSETSHRSLLYNKLKVLLSIHVIYVTKITKVFHFCIVRDNHSLLWRLLNIVYALAPMDVHGDTLWYSVVHYNETVC
jgi:hypothetical protein